MTPIRYDDMSSHGESRGGRGGRQPEAAARTPCLSRLDAHVVGVASGDLIGPSPTDEDGRANATSLRHDVGRALDEASFSRVEYAKCKPKDLTIACSVNHDVPCPGLCSWAEVRSPLFSELRS